MRHTTRRTAVLALSTILALAACGSDSNEVSGGSTEELASDATDAAGDATAGTDAAGATETTAAGATDGTDTENTAGDIELDGDFCASTAQMVERFDSLDTAGTDGASLGNVFSSFGEIIQALDQLEERAPDELKDDVATISEAFEPFRDKLDELEQFGADMTEAGNDPAKLQEVFTQYADLMSSLEATSMDSAEVDQAGENLNTYLSEVCGIDVGS
jgi:hypothetical protein